MLGAKPIKKALIKSGATAKIRFWTWREIGVGCEDKAIPQSDQALAFGQAMIVQSPDAKRTGQGACRAMGVDIAD